MTQFLKPFTPAAQHATVNMAVAQAGPLSVLEFDALLGGIKNPQVRLYNAGGNTILFEFCGKDVGSDQSLDVNTAMPLGPGMERVFSTSGATALVARSLNGPSQLYATPGHGS